MARAQDPAGSLTAAQTQERAHGPLVGLLGDYRASSHWAEGTGTAAAQVGLWLDDEPFEHALTLAVGVGINRGSCDERFELGGRLEYQMLWHTDWLVLGGAVGFYGFPQERCVSNGMFWHRVSTRDYMSLALIVGARVDDVRFGLAPRVSIVEAGGGGWPPDDPGGTGPVASVGLFVQAFL